jgi:hypothetical protein
MKITYENLRLLVEQEIERYNQDDLGRMNSRSPDAIYDKTGKRVDVNQPKKFDVPHVYYAGNMTVAVAVGQGEHSKNHRFFFEREEAQEYVRTSKYAQGFQIIKVPFVGSSSSRERISRRKCAFIVAEEKTIGYLGPGVPDDVPMELRMDVQPAKSRTKSLGGTGVMSSKEEKQPMKIFERCDEAIAFSGIAYKARQDLTDNPLVEDLTNPETGMPYTKITNWIYPVYSIQFEGYEGDKIETASYLAMLQSRAAAETGCGNNNYNQMMINMKNILNKGKKLASAKMRELGTGSGIKASSMGIGANVGSDAEAAAVPLKKKKK